LANPNPFDEAARTLLSELCERFPMGYVPTLQWKGLRVSAGMAYYNTRSIALSNRVLQTEEAMRETLTHEYAHLLAVHRHGRAGAGHGPAWRAAMRDLGLEPKVRHNLPVERNERRQKVVYRCRKCGFHLNRGRRFPGRARYYHVNCGGQFQFLGVEK
jgi:predicted SprT family Zn-dependent metalloprotease